MKFNSLIPELTVEDIERTKKFYIDILQFKVEYERPENKFIFLSLEGNQMMFEQENGHWVVGELEHPYGRGINFEMTVSDVEQIYNRVIEAGIKPFQVCTVELSITNLGVPAASHRSGFSGFRLSAPFLRNCPFRAAPTIPNALNDFYKRSVIF